MRPSNFWKYHASISGSAIFMSSDGWMRTMPRLSQRRDPFTTTPNSATPISSSTPSTYSGTAVRASVCGGMLATTHISDQREAEREQLRGHARHALVGRGKERDQPDADERERAAEQEAVDAARQRLPCAAQEFDGVHQVRPSVALVLALARRRDDGRARRPFLPSR